MATVCPSWFAFSLNNRLRRWLQDPDQILAPYVRPGMICADIGCGPGFFTMAMARLAGSEGRVLAVDLQQEMLHETMKLARREKLEERITACPARPGELGLNDYSGRIDFALSFYMAHEVPRTDRMAFWRQLFAAMKPGGRVLVTDPGVPWLASDFKRSMEYAGQEGFRIIENPHISLCRTALLQAWPLD